MKLRLFIIFITAILFFGCAGPEIQHGKMTPIKSRITFYSGAEDKRWGNRVACGGRAKEGITCAVNPRDIHYYSKIIIPEFNNYFKNNNQFLATDTGTALKTRKASKGKFPVVDIYVNSRKKMNEMAAKIAPVLDVYIIKN